MGGFHISRHFVSARHHNRRVLFDPSNDNRNLDRRFNPVRSRSLAELIDR
jgi:hypothetical protein